MRILSIKKGTVNLPPLFRLCIFPTIRLAAESLLEVRYGLLFTAHHAVDIHGNTI